MIKGTKGSIDPFRMAGMVQSALAWRELVENERPFKMTGCDNKHFKYAYPTHQWEMDAVCRACNSIYQKVGSLCRIGNINGELRPGRALKPEDL